MIEEIARHRCKDSEGSPLFVVERRHVFTTGGAVTTRRHRGAAWVALLDGEPVRYIDAETFEVVATGERLAHDPRQCDCLPAVRFSISTQGSNICPT